MDSCMVLSSLISENQKKVEKIYQLLYPCKFDCISYPHTLETRQIIYADYSDQLCIWQIKLLAFIIIKIFKSIITKAIYI